MPELPEVETIKRAIEASLKSATILDAVVYNPHLRKLVPSELPSLVRQQKIIGYERIAKYILIHLDNDYSLVLHLGMSGKIKISDTCPQKEKHDHLIFRTTEGFLVYNDARRFGLCLIVKTHNLANHPLFARIGIDPFDKKLNGAYLKEKLHKKTIAIKIALLDQYIICGIGNIYASEALFSAGILPTRPAKSLSLKECSLLVEKIRLTLQQAIAAGGSTLRDYQKPDGSLGYFQYMHCVYGKEGEPCPNCTCRIDKTHGIKKITQGGRSTYFCETKQR